MWHILMIINIQNVLKKKKKKKKKKFNFIRLLDLNYLILSLFSTRTIDILIWNYIYIISNYQIIKNKKLEKLKKNNKHNNNIRIFNSY